MVITLAATAFFTRWSLPGSEWRSGDPGARKGARPMAGGRDESLLVGQLMLVGWLVRLVMAGWFCLVVGCLVLPWSLVVAPCSVDLLKLHGTHVISGKPRVLYIAKAKTSWAAVKTDVMLDHHRNYLDGHPHLAVGYWPWLYMVRWYMGCHQTRGPFIYHDDIPVRSLTAHPHIDDVF